MSPLNPPAGEDEGEGVIDGSRYAENADDIRRYTFLEENHCGLPGMFS